LIRLAEARAKADLREVVTEHDAQDAVELMQYSLRDFVHDSRRSTAPKVRGNSMRAQGTRLVEALRQSAAADRKRQFSFADIQRTAAAIRLQVPDLDGLIGALNESSDLLKKGGGMYVVNFA
jgi:DNA helicase MCM8